MARITQGLLAIIFVGLVGCGPQSAQIDADENADTLDDLNTTDVASSTDQALNAAYLDTEESAFLRLINNYRASIGVGKLRVSIGLTRASDAHSLDMATTGKFQHNSSDGTDTFVRIARYYACNGSRAENIAFGTTSAQQVFDAWKASPDHNTNMRAAAYKAIGIARRANANGVYYWTTDFGDCLDAVLSQGFGTIASNGNFEGTDITPNTPWSAVRGLNRWYTGGSSGSAFTRSTTAHLDGSYGMRATDPDPGSSAVTQMVRGWAGVNYRARATARRVSGASQQLLYLEFLDGNYTRLAVKTAAAPATSTPTAFYVEASAPLGTRFVRVFGYGSAAAGSKSTYDWDAVRLEAW